MMKQLIMFLVDLVSLGSMGYGLWLIYPPSAFVVVGFLIWLEANIHVFKRTHRTEG